MKVTLWFIWIATNMAILLNTYGIRKKKAKLSTACNQN